MVVKVIALLPARAALTVILSEVSNANEVEGSRTASRQRSRYRFCGLASRVGSICSVNFLTKDTKSNQPIRIGIAREDRKWLYKPAVVIFSMR